MAKSTFCGIAALMALATFAGSVVEDGTDLVVTADSGESYTNSTAVGNYTRLVKRGAGEVVLTAATTAFAGSTVVEAGTLTITDLGALGSGTPVTVEDGATFWIKVPHPTGNQATPMFTGHAMTITGDGVDGKGAIRYTRTNSSGNADNLFNSITLADDATVECASRWGMREGTLDLAGHTLTRVGGSNMNWMFYNAIKAGTIVQTTGTMTFQAGPTFPDGTNTLVVVTNSGTLALWDASKPIDAAIKLYTGRTFSANSGTDPATRNIINGPIYIAKASGNTDAFLETKSNKGNTVMTINGAISGDTGYSYSDQARLTQTGPGTVYLNGPMDLEGNFTLKGGALVLTSDVTRASNGFSMKGNGKLILGDGHLDVKFLRVGNGGSQIASVYQTGGALSVFQNDAPRIGEYDGSCGFYTIAGGEVHISNSVYLAEHTGSFGAFRQTGGLFETRQTGSFYACKGTGGAGAAALFVQTGGTNDTLIVQNQQGGGFLTCNSNGVSEVTVSGTGTLFRTSLVQFGNLGSVSTNIFNLSNGAVMKANRFRQAENIAEGSLVCVNVDGGTMMPTYAWGWSAAGSGNVLFYPRTPQHVVVWKGGLVIDTSENASNNGDRAGSSVLSLKFEDPAGQGVESVALPTDSAFSATNYFGIARVVFEDETGWGASAYAEYDNEANKITEIVVTSRGCNYSGSVKAYLESPNRSTRYECAVTLSSNDGMAGELVKRGDPDLELYSTNSLTGGIAVEGGMLIAYTDGVIPSNTPVRVEYGATLSLANKSDATLSTFTGAGSVINGNVTVTNSVRATCAELFEGKHATFSKNLTFAEGATFTITDPENLETYSKRGSVPAFTALAVNGTPTLALEGDYELKNWTIFKKSAGTYNVGAIIGTAIVVR